MFLMLSGLTLEQLDILTNCVEPYLKRYLTILGSGESSTPSYGSRISQLLSLLTLCRQGLQANFMAFVFGKDKQWDPIFLGTVFNRVFSF